MMAMRIREFIDYRADIIGVMQERNAAQEKAMKNARKNLPHMKRVRMRKIKKK